MLGISQPATDTDFKCIESVVGHEYFHNWTGKPRDLPRLVPIVAERRFDRFPRSKSFPATGPAVVRRIDNVRMRLFQFPEDAGPTAHPVHPASYEEMNNFLHHDQVHEKGAEVVRMYHTCSEEGSKGMKVVMFQRHDGQAVTCDDFQCRNG